MRFTHTTGKLPAPSRLYPSVFQFHSMLVEQHSIFPTYTSIFQIGIKTVSLQKREECAGGIPSVRIATDSILFFRHSSRNVPLDRISIINKSDFSFYPFLVRSVSTCTHARRKQNLDFLFFLGKQRAIFSSNYCCNNRLLGSNIWCGLFAFFFS